MITTPDHWHVPIALGAIRAGKDVCCEKPIGLCIEHGRILADAAAESGCVFRADTEYRTMREEIDANPKIRNRPRWFEKISAVYWRMDRANRVVRMFQRQQTGAKLPVTLHVVRIGDMAIATHPMALYLDFGIQIKARSKAVQTFTVQLSNGAFGYLPTKRSVAGATARARRELHQLIEGLRSLSGRWRNMHIVATIAQIGVREGDGFTAFTRFRPTTCGRAAGIRTPSAALLLASMSTRPIRNSAKESRRRVFGPSHMISRCAP